MKRFLACLAVLVLSIFVFTACNADNGADNTSDNNAPVTEADNGLTNAKNYLYTMYKDANPVTPADYIRVATVRINGVSYEVKWTADSDTINFISSTSMVTILSSP